MTGRGGNDGGCGEDGGGGSDGGDGGEWCGGGPVRRAPGQIVGSPSRPLKPAWIGSPSPVRSIGRPAPGAASRRMG